MTTTSLLVPGPSMETGELEIVETSLIENIEMPSVALGIPAPRNYVEDDGPEWRELDYLVKVIIKSSYEVFFMIVFRSGPRRRHFFCSFNNMTGIFIQERLSHTR